MTATTPGSGLSLQGAVNTLRTASGLGATNHLAIARVLEEIESFQTRDWLAGIYAVMYPGRPVPKAPEQMVLELITELASAREQLQSQR